MNEKKYKKMRYPVFFATEINEFLIEKQNQSNKIQTTTKNQDDIEKFNAKRKKGENNSYLCNIIRNDLIEEFIIYINKELYSLENLVDKSIFETNDFLLKRNQTSLIQYAAFFGSNQIFKYLYLNGNDIQNLLLKTAKT